MRNYLIITLTTFICSCTSNPPPRPFKAIEISDKNAGIIYVYYFCDHKKSLKSGGDIYINGVKKTYISQGAYYGTLLHKGRHTVEYKGYKSPDFSLDFYLAPGEHRYIRIDIPEFLVGDSGSGVVRYEMKEVTAKRGASEIQNCHWAKIP